MGSEDLAQMDHPSVDEILADSAACRAHLGACARCRKLIALLAAPVLGTGNPTADLTELPQVDAALYADFSELAARGGMGRVFRVRDRRLHRTVALKKPQQHTSAGGVDGLLEARFEREALLTARLQHPSIVGIYEAGRFEDGQPFYVMPLLAGVTLSERIAQAPELTDRLKLLPAFSAVVEAVAYAHQCGIVHRDLKPDNVLLGNFGETVVVDWGLAKDLAALDAESAAEGAPVADGLTELGVGTPQYMPPEQARGEPPDVRLDVYALGATLYHLLSGLPPYGAGRSDVIRRRLFTEPPRPLRELAPEAPPELLGIVSRAMARDPQRRYATARELGDELRRYLTGQLLQSRRYTALELLRHFARRHRASLRTFAGAAVVLAAFGVWSFLRVARERDLARQSQRTAEHELHRSQGVVASRLAALPSRRLEAILLGLRALGAEQASPEALQGLFDALTAGPALLPLRHQGAIKNFDRSPDGSRLAAIDDARALVLWDGRTGAALATWPTGLPQPEKLRVAPDGARAVVWGYDPAIELFQLASGRKQHLDTKDEVAGSDFLPDGELVVAAEDVTVRDPTSLAVLRRFALPAPAAALRVRSDGLIAVSSTDGSLWLWPRDGEPRALSRSGASSLAMQFDEGGRLVQIGADQVVRSWPTLGAGVSTVLYSDQRTMPRSLLAGPGARVLAAGMFDFDGARRTAIFDGAGVREAEGDAVAWSDDPRWFVADHKGPLTLVEARSGRSVLALAAHEDEVRALFAGGLLASASLDGPAFLWDLHRGKETGLLLGHTGEIVLALASPTGDRALTASLDGTARIWSRAGEEVALLQGEGELLAAAWSADGGSVYLGGLDRAVRRFDAANGRLLATHGGAAPISCLAISPDGKSVLSGALDGRLELLDADLGSPRTLGTALDAVTAAAFAPDGLRVASAHADGTTRLWDARTGAPLALRPEAAPVDEPGDHEGATALFFSPDGARLFAGRPTGETLVFDARTLAPLATLEGRALRLSPDGRRLAAAGSSAILIHDLAGGPVQRLEGQRAAILALAFSPRGTSLASGSVDGRITLWDLESGREIASIGSGGANGSGAAGLGEVSALAMLDDDWLFAGYSTGALRLHPARAAAAVERACRIAKRFAQDAGPSCGR
jgi:WD40 repeat protein